MVINTSILLEAYSKADVIFAQEIYWGHIKSVAYIKDKEGDSYENWLYSAHLWAAK